MVLNFPISILLVLASIFLLWFGADWLVKGSSKLALSMNIKPLIIGLTVVAFGTSAPELVVSVMAALSGSTEMALGNVIGSNIANIALVLGVCAVITPLEVSKDTIKSDIPFLVLVSFLAYILARYGATEPGGTLPGLSRMDGVIMLGFLVYFLVRLFIKSKSGNDVDPELQELMMEEKTPNWKNIVLVVIGITFLVGGAKSLVTGGSFIALKMGIPEFFISLTMVAIGTSIPELAASGMAAYRKETDLCLGNVIGSNIMNLLIVLAVTVCILPIPVSAKVIKFELPGIVFVAVILYFMCRLGDFKITRTKGVILLVIYVTFIFMSSPAGSSLFGPAGN
ncbi:MAG: calcium/sodium antiporter [Lentisphaeraceae bacterium]|nr:calcium/sodium antiporter [Lentisphaeraceae bacterium]